MGDTSDRTAPLGPTDLTVTDITLSSVSLRWTAPGDDGQSGRAFEYDLRYSDQAISDLNFDSAVQLSGEPLPDSAGAIDSMQITGLVEDSTYFFALRTCDEAGNWSEISNNANATCFDDFEVIFSDPRLDYWVRGEITKPTEPIFRSDLLALTSLSANVDSIADLTGLEHCSNLTTISMSRNRLDGLSPLAGLTELIDLNLEMNQIRDLAPMTGLTGLATLRLNVNNITDISALSGLDQLTSLGLSDNRITSITALSGLQSLIWLDLSYNQVTSLSSLSGLTALQNLYLSDNQFNDISSLADMAELSELYIQYTQTADITALSALSKLHRLALVGNKISDISPLVANDSLNAGDIIYLEANPLSNESINTHIPALQARGVTVYY